MEQWPGGRELVSVYLFSIKCWILRICSSNKCQCWPDCCLVDNKSYRSNSNFRKCQPTGLKKFHQNSILWGEARWSERKWCQNSHPTCNLIRPILSVLRFVHPQICPLFSSLSFTCQFEVYGTQKNTSNTALISLVVYLKYASIFTKENKH